LGGILKDSLDRPPLEELITDRNLNRTPLTHFSLASLPLLHSIMDKSILLLFPEKELECFSIFLQGAPPG
jgi:hypothetical protein